MALNLFVNFLRFVVIFPNVFLYPAKLLIFHLNSHSQFWGILYYIDHEYFNIDYDVVWEVLNNDFPELSQQINKYGHVDILSGDLTQSK